MDPARWRPRDLPDTFLSLPRPARSGVLPRVGSVLLMHAPGPGRDSAEEIVADFERAHAARFGFFDRGRSLVLEAVSVEAVGAGALLAAEGRRPKQPTDVSDAQPGDPPQATWSVRFFNCGSWHDAAVHLRGELSEGDQVSGPALIIEPHQTVVVEPGTHLPDITVCTPVFDETGAELLFWVAARGPAGPGFDARTPCRRT